MAQPVGGGPPKSRIVEHHGLGCGRPRLLQGLAAVLGQPNLVAPEGERAAQGVADRSIVVDNQDSHSPIVPATRGNRADSYEALTRRFATAGGRI